MFIKKIQNECAGISISHKKIESVPGNMNTNHCHDKYEIIYVQEGQGKYIVEGVEYPVKPRTLMVFPPLVYHCVSVEVGSSYDRYVLFFDKNMVIDTVEASFSALNASAASAGAFYSAEAISDSIITIFDRFEAAESLPEAEYTVYSKLILAELLLLLSVAKREDFRPDDIELGARVIRYLNENTDRDISLDMLAKKFFVSKYYLCRAFKKHNGISVHGYIQQKRVMYAKQLIEAGETASGAAYRVGFGDYSAFYRAYIKVLGSAPTAFDSKNKKEMP